jgi:4-amino-4-deoxy-L-arabinose transferase-like glycosyltransferase
VLFFSLSSGKRGVYILPALPAVALASAPYLIELAQRRTVRRAMFALSALTAVMCLLASIYVTIRPDRRNELLAEYDIDVFGPLLTIGIVTALVCLLTRPRRAFIAWAGMLATVLLVISYWVNPVMNPNRSGATFIIRVEEHDDPNAELGFVAFKEQYLLNVHRPIVHFGHARWREAEQEAADAALWLSRSNRRQLVVSENMRQLCFADVSAESLGMANRVQWYIVRGQPKEECVARGNEAAVYHYAPPRAR